MAAGRWDAEDEALRSISERRFDVVWPVGERHLIYTPDVKPAVPTSQATLHIFAPWQKFHSTVQSAASRSFRPPRISTISHKSSISGSGAPRAGSPYGILPSNLRCFASSASRYQLQRAPLPSARPPALPTRCLRAHACHPPWPPRLHRALPQPRNLELDVLQLGAASRPSWLIFSLPDNDPERMEKMFAHCLPTITQIVPKIHDVRSLDVEQTDMSMAIDMQIAGKLRSLLATGCVLFSSSPRRAAAPDRFLQPPQLSPFFSAVSVVVKAHSAAAAQRLDREFIAYSVLRAWQGALQDFSDLKRTDRHTRFARLARLPQGGVVHNDVEYRNVTQSEMAGPLIIDFDEASCKELRPCCTVPAAGYSNLTLAAELAALDRVPAQGSDSPASLLPI
ncbi:hypothetical protein K438DRAFT_1982510 [Mycena galopus ATCC 62051]|nr:hypothetical protein K438DRAFT_1982510 [Mycena galopus ATCC 62051]